MADGILEGIEGRGASMPDARRSEPPRPFRVASPLPDFDPAGAGGETTSSGTNLLFYVIAYPFALAIALRGITDGISNDHRIPWLVVALLLTYVVLLGTARWITNHAGAYTLAYFPVQTIVVLGLLAQLPDSDYFAALFIPLSVQAIFICSRRIGYRWIGVFTASMAAGMLVTQGWPDAIPFILLYGGSYVFVGSYAMVTARADNARKQSQSLLAELRDAYGQLQSYAEQVGELAVIDERNRLSRELHDSVTQALYGLTLAAEAAARNVTAGEETTALAQLKDVQSIAREALAEMRLLIFELRPSMLEREGLATTLQARLAAVEGRSGLAVELDAPDGDRLAPATEAGLERIAQEALNNTLKHAHASRIAVRLRQDPRVVVLEITDDGVGFDPSSAQSRGGLGLRGMAERVAQLGGRLTVRSGSGEGTDIRVEVPR